MITFAHTKKKNLLNFNGPSVERLLKKIDQKLAHETSSNNLKRLKKLLVRKRTLQKNRRNIFEKCPPKFDQQDEPMISHNSTSSYQFYDDICYEILSFIDDWKLILLTCSLISKQWLNVVRERVKLCVEFKNPIVSKKTIKLMMNRECLEQFESMNVRGISRLQFYKIFEKTKQLTKLDIGKSIIWLEGFKSITELKHLNSLDMNNMVFMEKESKLELLESISQLHQLTCLNISSNNVGFNTFKPIGNVKQLTYLDVSWNYISDEGAKVLSQLSQLTHLNVNCTIIGIEGAKYISKLTKLRTLIAARNNFWIEGCQYFSEMEQLTALDVSHNSIGNTGIKYLSKMKQLTELNINDNAINQFGTEESKLIRELSQLTKLSISSNNIGIEGVTAISTMSQLRTLNIFFNRIGLAGAKLISGMQNLTVLDICNNDIGTNGAKEISKMKQLTKLDIARNMIGNEGAKALKSMKQLKSLRNTFNNIIWNDDEDLSLGEIL
ncbi:hypothetical protein NAEGRDRAFT_58930 [Naegleria gruberi]|uniref:LRR_RI domain-containing protein n=1 Tax=Naegleria gruberi TaxID=5762 RepID=D2VQE8_NAEGR|nr:uncharacterized protein NAEGRDRAFT_58930 [Naegleria gruberi]EFC40860.1 hypothetical protein NAEGRDRAFT_58930 [Naegleria gruberi]|eukprot:XP_002673604.1 hypothetical protein NAEGRDRAFT_58930 [Naegleria gruberi strain NEG-M]